MDRNFLIQKFIECLSGEINDFGFRYIKSKNAFVRNVTFGEQWYTLTFITYKGKNGFEIIPGHHVRNEKVESLFHESSGFEKKDQKHTTTIGCSLDNYLANGKELFRMCVENEKDVIVACDFYNEIFIEQIIPFFERYSTLESLHVLINSNPQIDLNIINPIFRGIKGVIIAKILDSKELDSLIEVYSNQYEFHFDGFYKSIFDRVLEGFNK